MESNNDTRDGDEQNKNGILQVLERNLQAGKRTLRDCLRSKSLPCREVKYVMEHVHDKTSLQIQAAFHELCNTRYLEVLVSPTIPPRPLFTSPDSTSQQHDDPKTFSSSLECMTKVGTAVKFIQLLFEWDKSPDNCYNGRQQLVIVPMASTLLKQLCESILSSVQAWINEAEIDNDDGQDDLWEADVPNCFHGPIVASFAFGLLVRLSPYIKKYSLLVSPWLKGLCDIASATPNLPTGLKIEAVKAVITYLREGEEQIAALWESMLQKPESPSSFKPIQLLVRILMFLVARVTTLIKLALHDDNALAADVSQLFAVMAHLLGLPIMSALRSPSPTHQVSTSVDSILPLTAKLKECLCKLIFRKCTDQWNTAIIHSGALEHFLKRTKEDEPGWNERSLFGKTEMILTVLDCYSKAQSDTGTFVEADVEGLLSLCKELIFHCLPMCHSHLILATTAPDSTRHAMMAFISRSMETLSKSLLLFELRCFGLLLNADRGRGHFHRMLVRWLSPVVARHHHPITREIVVRLVCMHVLNLNNVCSARSNDSPRSVHDVPILQTQLDYEDPLLSVLVKLLFDARTRVGHRDVLADVVLRLTRGGTEGLRRKVESHVANELNQLLVAKETSRPRKRKRAKSKPTLKAFSIDDLQIIASVVSKIPWTARQASIEQEMKACLTELMEKAAEVQRRTIQSTMLFVSLFQAQMRLSSDRTQLVQDDDKFSLLERVCNRTTWPGFGFKKKRVAMATCLVRLASTVCDIYSRALPPELVNRLIEMVVHYSKYAKGSKGDPSEYSLAVLLEVIVLLGKLGKIMLPNCPTQVGEVGRKANSTKALLANVKLIVRCPTFPKAIVSAFRNLQKSGSWPLLVLTMTSSERFASTVPAAHRELLTRCTRKEYVGFIQSRLQGRVWRFMPRNEVCLKYRHCGTLKKAAILMIYLQTSRWWMNLLL